MGVNHDYNDKQNDIVYFLNHENGSLENDSNLAIDRICLRKREN